MSQDHTQSSENSVLGANYTTVGVIGHIDHGKTSLVGILTGTETDTHPEEKRRGITIDLGFAAMQDGEHTFAFIDAPGHQKYVGNLLAGVSAVDVGLLVVACDQGIQEQTLEHVSILSTLQVPRMIVALSRVDLCSESRVAEITEELEVFLSDFGFTDFPVVPTSVVSGKGLDLLRKELRAAAACQASENEVANRLRESQPFRMPIDRVLNVPGRGLVVAGTPWKGRIQVGDRLQFAGRETELRVREVEIHGQMTASSRCGVRTAINIAGHDDSPVSRGDELVAQDSYPLAQVFLVSLKVYDEAKEIKLPTTTQLHSATGSIEARLLGPKKLTPGTQCVVLVETEQNILGVYGQAVLMRHPYPVGSFGGGRIVGVLDAGVKKTGISKREQIQLGDRLAQEDSIGRVKAWIDFLGELQIDSSWLHWQVGLEDAQVDGIEAELGQLPDIERIGAAFVSKALLEKVTSFLSATLRKHAEENEDHWVLEESLAQRASHLASPAIIRRAMQQLTEAKDGAEPAVVGLNGMLAVASEKTKLSKKQRAKMEQMLKLFEDSRTPPTIKEICEKLSLHVDSANSLARHATQQRLLLDLQQGFFMSAAVFREMCHELTELFAQETELTVPTIKERWGVTRKHVIPLLEYCDRNQITKRSEEGRLAGPNLNEFAQSAS